MKSDIILKETDRRFELTSNKNSFQTMNPILYRYNYFLIRIDHIMHTQQKQSLTKVPRNAPASPNAWQRKRGTKKTCSSFGHLAPLPTCGPYRVSCWSINQHLLGHKTLVVSHALEDYLPPEADGEFDSLFFQDGFQSLNKFLRRLVVF